MSCCSNRTEHIAHVFHACFIHNILVHKAHSLEWESQILVLSPASGSKSRTSSLPSLASGHIAAWCSATVRARLPMDHHRPALVPGRVARVAARRRPRVHPPWSQQHAPVRQSAVPAAVCSSGLPIGEHNKELQGWPYTAIPMLVIGKQEHPLLVPYTGFRVTDFW